MSPPSRGSVLSPTVDRVVGGYRSVTKFLGRRALARATLAVPRTLSFVVESARSGEISGSVTAPSLSLGFAAGVAMDETLLAMALAPSRFPRRADYTRVAEELAETRPIYSRRGWLTRRVGYHRTPPPMGPGATGIAGDPDRRDA